MNTAVAISAIAVAVFTVLGAIFKGGGAVIKHIVDLLGELKTNTKAIETVGQKIDENFSSTTLKLTDHENRITKLEDRHNG